MEEEPDALQELADRLGEGGKSTELCCKGGSDSGVEENCAQGNAEGASCDSSLVSYCNSSEELVSNSHQCDAVESEGGSESSSVASHQGPGTVHFRRESRPTRQSCPLSASRRALHKERSLSRTPGSTKTLATSKPGSGLTRSLSVRTPDTLKSTPRLNRVRSPAVTPDDGRWPSNVSRQAKPKEKKAMTSSLGPVDSKLAFEKCATLPRRRRRSADNLLSPPSESAPSSRARDPSLNRTASLRRKKLQESQMASSTPPKPSTPSSATLPKGKPKMRTRIFHETAVQTSLTAKDMEAGVLPHDIHSRVTTCTAAVQADRRMENVEKLETELKELQQKFRRITLEKENLEKLREELKIEREKRERQEERLRQLLPEPCEGDVVSAVEKEHNLAKDVCENQQKEINHIQSLCCNLKKELDKSLRAQRKILEQQHDAEAESLEMQEFLLAEKSTLADTLKELESEMHDMKKTLESKEVELVKQQDECVHLVRMCEQRRQETLYLESRLRAVETCSKESMLVHGAAASGAAVALSGLGNRLEILVEALVTAYEISQADLEDVVFHNEAFAHSSGSSPSESSSGKSSPRQMKTGFVSAIINAIKAATLRSTPDTFSDGDLLSAEPEPSGFLKDITCNSSPGDKRHSIASLPSLSDTSPSKCSNRASYAASELDLELGGEPLPSEGGMTNSESLQNLSEAIIRRQKEEEESAKEMAVSRSVQTGLIDQVIDVDNLITKLLKVMHIIQSRGQTSEIGETKKVSSKAVIDSLKNQIQALNEELKNSSNSSLQVENLQKALLLKERELNELEKKFTLTEELLTSNWHKAMTEVRRQYEAVDRALELLDTIKDQVDEDTVLSCLKKELQETNTRSSSTLPVSTSQPDLNANDANTRDTKNMNGT